MSVRMPGPITHYRSPITGTRLAVHSPTGVIAMQASLPAAAQTPAATLSAIAWSGAGRRRGPDAACRAAVRRGDREGDGEHGSEGNGRHGDGGSASSAGGATRRKSTDCPSARARNADSGDAPDVAAALAGPIGRNGAGPTGSRAPCHRSHAKGRDHRSPTARAGGPTVTGCPVCHAFDPGHASRRTTHRSRHAAAAGSIVPAVHGGDRGCFWHGQETRGRRAAASRGTEPGRAAINCTKWPITAGP